MAICLVRERARDDVAENLHVAVRVRGNPLPGATKSSLITRSERKPMCAGHSNRQS